MSRKRKTEAVKQKSPLISIITDFRTIVVTIIATIIAGIILAYIIQDARFAPDRKVLETPTHSVNLNLGSGSIKIEQGQMLMLANENGAAIVRFIFSEYGATYQWRYKSYDSQEEKTGSGTLYEIYARTQISENETNLVDEGSSLTILVEDFRATWSAAGKTSGWIYYKSLGVDVIEDSTFDTFDLSSLKMSK